MTDATTDHIEQLLTPLRNSIVDKPPFASGSLQLPASLFSLFYKVTKDDHAAGEHINFVDATRSRLSCTDSTCTSLLRHGVVFKPHVDTPRNEKMFESLLVTFPTRHEGGALLLRHRGQEWTFDPASVLAAAQPPSIAYAAFFSDIEHEVVPVTSGHRVTLTYNLYFDDNKYVSAKDLVLEPPSAPQEENERMFRSAFEALLKNPEFLPDGGMLGFGLRHMYQVEYSLEHVYSLLKGSDAAVYQSVRGLGFKPVLYLYYEQFGDEDFEAVLTEGVPLPRDDRTVEDPVAMLHSYGGICIRRGKQEVKWVTPLTRINRQESAYIAYGNEPSLGMAYGDVCLLVRIGKVGERLVIQLEEEDHRRFYY